MNNTDWIIIAVTVISILISIQRGLIKEVISLAVWVVALIVALVFYKPVATLLQGIIDSPSVRTVLAFGILFIAILVVGAIFNYVISILVRKTGLSNADRILGIVFGIIRAVVIIMALLIFLPLILPVDQESWWQQSRLIPYFEQIEQWFKEVFNQLIVLGSQYIEE